MEREMHGGVLVIGSLLWDPCQIRDKWRKDWLNLDQAKRVLAPIRYGRLSTKRGSTYTMVFSRLCLRPSYRGGTAVVVPFKHRIQDKASLISTARALWSAEEKSQNSERRIAKSWGAIGILVNPKRSIDELLEWWRYEIKRQRNYRAPTCLKREGPVLDKKSGQLLIPWPQTLSGDPLGLDFLLVTATDPKLVVTVTGQRYPSVKQIASRWIADKSGKV